MTVGPKSLLEKVFPARAGMSPASLVGLNLRSSFPRTRGDEPDPEAKRLARESFSPHARG